jgi:hypothetical protein
MRAPILPAKRCNYPGTRRDQLGQRNTDKSGHCWSEKQLPIQLATLLLVTFQLATLTTRQLDHSQLWQLVTLKPRHLTTCHSDNSPPVQFATRTTCHHYSSSLRWLIYGKIVGVHKRRPPRWGASQTASIFLCSSYSSNVERCTRLYCFPDFSLNYADFYFRYVRSDT